ncbi:hypothetical protein [Butyrivibrio sp. MC2021]|uniref:hypothetical protein n=1 Tax=Butyrivibrio sp. MC2021 TaxID=1408306 RepID=UPI0006891D07|nr:hypothetical protein [Butyrivibrio sp. MC2021]
MRSKVFCKLLGVTLSAALTITSAFPVYASEVLFQEEDAVSEVAELLEETDEALLLEEDPGEAPVPGANLVVEPEAATTDVLGKLVSELQEDIVITAPTDSANGKIEGTLLPVEGYTGFSSKEDEQSGYYLVLKADDPAATKIQVGINPSKTFEEPDRLVELDADRNIVLKVSDIETQKVNILFTYDDDNFTLLTYDISGLTLKSATDPAEPIEKNITVAAEDQAKVVFDLVTSDLQYSDVVVTAPTETADGTITGTLKYVKDWTTFSSDPELQTGYYLVLKADDPNAAKVEVGINPSKAFEDPDHLVTLDEDRNIVLKVTDKDTQKVTVKFTYSDDSTETLVYGLTGLTLEAETPVATTYPVFMEYRLDGGTATPELAESEILEVDGKAGTVVKDLSGVTVTKEGYDFEGWEVYGTYRNYFGFGTGEEANVLKLRSDITDIEDDIYIAVKAVFEEQADHEHNWVEAYWNWYDHYTEAELTMRCTICYEEKEISTTDITAEEKGKVTLYTAKVTYAGQEFSTKIAVIKQADDQEIEIEDIDQAENVVERGLLVYNIYDRVYTGSAITFPSLKAYWYTGNDRVLLVEGTDYTVKYANNKLPGKEASVTLKGKGQYANKFTETYYFEISKANITSTSLSLNSSYQYVGGKSTITLKLNGKKVKKNQYKIELVSAPEGGDNLQFGQAYKVPGSYQWKVIPTENSYFQGERGIYISVYEKNDTIFASQLKVKITEKNNAIEKVDGILKYPTPAFTVSYGKTTLSSTDEAFTSQFSYSYYNTNAGTGWLYVYPKNADSKIGDKRVVGTAYQKFTIKGLPLPDAFKALDGAEVPYSGSTWSLSEVVEELEMDFDDFANTLDSSDYYYSTNGRVEPGTLAITFRGRGIYEGSIIKNIKIRPVSDFGGYEYRALLNDEVYNKNAADEDMIEVPYMAGGAVVENFRLYRFYDKLLREGIEYTVSYSNNKKVGDTGELNIIGKGKNYGKATAKFKVVPNTTNNVYTIPVDVKSADKADGKKVPVVCDGVTGAKLTEGKDFKYTYASAVGEDGVLAVTITNGTEGTYDFGEEGITLPGYNVNKKAISAKQIKVKDKYYTGRAVKLTADDFTGLTLGKDFVIVGYKKNIKSGTAQVMIQGIGEYGGKATLKFKISKFEKFD